MPPWAPSTRTSARDFSASRSARVMKRRNSWVVFDIPTDRKTTFPAADGLPSASSGAICPAARIAARRWASGTSFLPAP